MLRLLCRGSFLAVAPALLNQNHYSTTQNSRCMSDSHVVVPGI
jgi:hypothetical protein